MLSNSQSGQVVSRRPALLLLGAAGASALMTACGAAGATKLVEKKELPTIRLLVLQDQSMSVGQNGVPRIASEDLQALGKSMRKFRGEVAFGLIDDRSSAAFVRVRTTAPPPAPETIDNAYQRPAARLELKNWEDAAAVEWTHFTNRVNKILAAPARARMTDVATAMGKALTYFGEDDRPCYRAVLLVTDLEHTAGARAIPVLPANVARFVVAGVKRPKLPGARYFESASAAILAIEEAAEGAKQ